MFHCWRSEPRKYREACFSNTLWTRLGTIILIVLNDDSDFFLSIYNFQLSVGYPWLSFYRLSEVIHHHRLVFLVSRSDKKCKHKAPDGHFASRGAMRVDHDISTSLHRRTMSYKVDQCTGSLASFTVISSYCLSKDNPQAYVIVCYYATRDVPYMFKIQRGTCTDDEVCVRTSYPGHSYYAECYSKHSIRQLAALALQRSNPKHCSSGGN